MLYKFHEKLIVFDKFELKKVIYLYKKSLFEAEVGNLLNFFFIIFMNSWKKWFEDFENLK